MRILIRLIVCALAFAAAPALARLTTITITSVEPFAGGAAFGDGGAYERVSGIFKGELDPRDPRNKVIVNLDKAPRNASGNVEYEADFSMLRPVEAARGNAKLIYDVTNRGRKNLYRRLMDTRIRTDPRSAEDVISPFVLRAGYTVVWSGWEPDASRTGGGLAMKPVIATNGGTPIVKAVRDEFVSGTRNREEVSDTGPGPQRDSFRLTYEAATLDPIQARLSVRRHEADARREIAAGGWGYMSAREIQLLPPGTKPETGSLYELHYLAKNPHVFAIGMAAARDLVSFLRRETRDSQGTSNPAGARIKSAIAFGSSQSGRFLRDYVKDGFNQDEAAGKVFDGVMAHVAGAGGVFLNSEFAQPNRTSTQHEDHSFPEIAFPFSTARMNDPVTGKTATLFRNDGYDPLWIETNTSTEYWQKGASLLSTDPLGIRDVELPANARSYLVASTQHNAAAWTSSTRGSCVNPRNPHAMTALHRALLVALEDWVDGKAPPDSRIPRIQDGTFTSAVDLKFPRVPELEVARRVNEVGIIRDWIKPEIDTARRYRVLVPQVDADGNEAAGIRLPDIAVPVATYTGWNLYRAPFPEGALCDRDGSYAPFARTRAEREARGDPRLSLEERYGSHANYVKRYEEAVQRLVRERLLLPEDAERYIARVRSNEVAKLFSSSVIGQAQQR